MHRNLSENFQKFNKVLLFKVFFLRKFCFSVEAKMTETVRLKTGNNALRLFNLLDGFGVKFMFVLEIVPALEPQDLLLKLSQLVTLVYLNEPRVKFTTFFSRRHSCIELRRVERLSVLRGYCPKSNRPCLEPPTLENVPNEVQGGMHRINISF